MGYEKSSTKLDGFIAEALRNEEIQDGARRAELEEEFLASSSKKKLQKFGKPRLAKSKLMNNWKIHVWLG